MADTEGGLIPGRNQHSTMMDLKPTVWNKGAKAIKDSIPIGFGATPESAEFAAIDMDARHFWGWSGAVLATQGRAEGRDGGAISAFAAGPCRSG